MKSTLFGQIPLALVVSIVAGAPLAAQAPTGHSHTTPHGGEIVEVAEHHIEFKAVPSGTISVWVLDENLKPTTVPGEASVTLMPEAGAPQTLPLKPDPSTGGLTARFDPARWSAFQAVVRVPIEGKPHNVRFQYPARH